VAQWVSRHTGVDGQHEVRGGNPGRAYVPYIPHNMVIAHDMVWRLRRPTQQEGQPVATTTWYPRWCEPRTQTQAGYCPLRRRHDRTDLVDARDLLTREVRARHGELEVAILEELGRHVLQLQSRRTAAVLWWHGACGAVALGLYCSRGPG
jgi:hypothetical protein